MQFFLVKEHATNATSCMQWLWKSLDEVMVTQLNFGDMHTGKIISTVVLAPTTTFRCKDSVHFIMEITWGTYSL